MRQRFETLVVSHGGRQVDGRYLDSVRARHRRPRAASLARGETGLQHARGSPPVATMTAAPGEETKTRRGRPPMT